VSKGHIAVTLYKRLDYSRRVLEHLKACAGIEDYLVSLHVEPGYPRVLELARSFPLPNRNLVVNDTRLGCTANIHSALKYGFMRSEYVIMVEDDVLLAPGALKYFEWAREVFRDDPSIFTVAAYRKEEVAAKDFYTYGKEQWFTPWGWATWKDRFVEMTDKWGWNEVDSWDCVVSKHARGERYQVYPTLSRSQNIGAVGGTYCPGPEWHKDNQFNPFWAGLPELGIDPNTKEFSRRS
jgi:hypothetical protein